MQKTVEQLTKVVGMLDSVSSFIHPEQRVVLTFITGNATQSITVERILDLASVRKHRILFEKIAIDDPNFMVKVRGSTRLAVLVDSSVQLDSMQRIALEASLATCSMATGCSISSLVIGFS